MLRTNTGFGWIGKETRGSVRRRRRGAAAGRRGGRSMRRRCVWNGTKAKRVSPGKIEAPLAQFLRRPTYGLDSIQACLKIEVKSLWYLGLYFFYEVSLGILVKSWPVFSQEGKC